MPKPSIGVIAQLGERTTEVTQSLNRKVAGSIPAHPIRFLHFNNSFFLSCFYPPQLDFLVATSLTGVIAQLGERTTEVIQSHNRKVAGSIPAHPILFSLFAP
jgi:hypothetical protein